MAESVFIAGMFVKYGKNLKSSADVQVMKNLQKKQKKQWMRCIRQCWIMDGTENGSCVPMMHSPKKLDQKSVKKENFY